MFGLSPGSARSAGNGVGTAQVIYVKWGYDKERKVDIRQPG